MISLLKKYRYFSWNALWEMVFNPFKTVSILMEQRRKLDKIHSGTKSFLIGNYVYVRRDIYEIDPVPILEVYEEMKPKEKMFIRSANLQVMWKAIKLSVEKSNE